MRFGLILLAALLPLAWLLAACQENAVPAPRYHLGAPYQAGGIWHYPRENFSLLATGLAAVADARHAPLTANGEAYDPTAMAAGHPTLQLPSIARVINLENGLALNLRINDRGPARPHRLLELTPRAAQLLGIPPAGGAQIRLEVLETESRAAVEGLGGTPALQIATAPRGDVQVDGAAPRTSAPEAPASAAVPTRLPEALIQTSLGPGALFIRLGSFGRAEFAERQRARLAHLAPSLETLREGRQTTYSLRIGPLPNVVSADTTLDQVIRAGVSDARIVIGHGP